MTNEPKMLSISELIKDSHYIVPVYQRNYAWGKEEIAQLIRDIADQTVLATAHYYIGTLITATLDDRVELFEVIDGQQRLITLFLLICGLRNTYPDIKLLEEYSFSLTFQSRLSATHTLKKLSENGALRYTDSENEEIVNGYEHIIDLLTTTVTDAGCAVADFVIYLLHHVMILRVVVPEGTDHNHYFEIMNTRGEQLEMHEILKAECLNQLKNDKRSSDVFATIWDACANMDRYVQTNFSSDWRKAVFNDDCSALAATSFTNLLQCIEGISEKQLSDSYSLQQILTQEVKGKKNGAAGSDLSDTLRFTSIITFPHFLLHVLAVHKDISLQLDDKHLLSQFRKYLNEEGSEFVKNISYRLLACRVLFDRYIIKRDNSTANREWSLKQFKIVKKDSSYTNTFYDEGQTVLMLQAMFHVSSPTQSYKHWLNASLVYLCKVKEVDASGFTVFLEQLARAYLADRFLAARPAEYADIIFANKCRAVNKQPDMDQLHRNSWKVANFIFNYLDYLLWKERVDGFKKFEFTFRSSVEHHYPQNPKDGKRLPAPVLNNFGNLCLISSGQNSRLRNDSPEEKKKYYLSPSVTVSLKQRVMMDYITWGADQIIQHGENMKKMLMYGPTADRQKTDVLSESLN